MAKEVIVILRGCLPPMLHSWLWERKHPPSSIAILVGQCTEASQAQYLAELVEEGFRVFEAAVPSQEMIFLDRRVGYYLPGWQPVSDPFPLACTFMWRRLGSFLVLEGTVGQANPVFFTLVGNQGLLVYTRGLGAPEPGERVRVLALHSFLSGWSTPFPVFACWIGRALDYGGPGR
jgi:hypothetical protein